MRYREISKILGKYLFYFSFILCVPFAVAVYFDFISIYKHSSQPSSSLEFLETILICLVLSFLFRFLGKGAKKQIEKKESIFLVVVIWLISAFIGALPFYLTKTLENPVDAYFEAMSGFTTTGATVMYPKAYNSLGKEIPIYDTNIHVPEKTYKFWGTISPIREGKTGRILFSGVEAVSKGVQFWRSFSQWLGGMGIVVLFLAILPALAVGGKFLYQMEMPGPTKESLTPRIKDTASILWKLYFTLTIIEIYLLIWTNPQMPLFDAFCITFSNLSTGGFTITNQSIGSYNNIFTEWIVIIFMFIASTNFALYFQLLRRKLYRIYEPDYLFYVGMIIMGAFFVTIFLIGGTQHSLDGSIATYSTSSAIRDGCFQAISAQTSTGFVTTNYDLWPFAPQIFMLLLMFVGGMAGSTAGGIKTSRFYILFKIFAHKIENIFRPEDVRKLKVGEKEITSNTAITVLTFFFIVILFAAFGMVLLIINGIDPETAIATITCMMNNIGIAFRAAGPVYSFAFLPNFSKIISILWMLFGRLEFFAVLLLFLPAFWKKK